MEEGLELYIPKGPRKLVDHYRPNFRSEQAATTRKQSRPSGLGTATAGTGTASSQNLGSYGSTSERTSEPLE